MRWRPLKLLLAPLPPPISPVLLQLFANCYSSPAATACTNAITGARAAPDVLVFSEAAHKVVGSSSSSFVSWGQRVVGYIAPNPHLLELKL